jgi:F0F1-type ATP synthase assembly protein I
MSAGQLAAWLAFVIFAYFVGFFSGWAFREEMAS